AILGLAEGQRIFVQAFDDFPIGSDKPLAGSCLHRLQVQLLEDGPVCLRHAHVKADRLSISLGGHWSFWSNCRCASSSSARTSSAEMPSSSSVYFCKSAAVKVSLARR